MWIKGFEVDLKIYVAIAYLDKSFGIFSKKKKTNRRAKTNRTINFKSFRTPWNNFKSFRTCLLEFARFASKLPIVFKHGSLNLKSQ